MQYKIHGKNSPEDEEYDSVIIEGETIEELRETAQQECEKRKWTDCWSEKISE